MSLQFIKSASLVVCASLFVGCAGVKTFPNTVQGGETATIATGWQHHFSRNDITITMTPTVGPVVTYNAGDPEIRAVVNLYPDPVSSMVLSQETGNDITPSARTYSMFVNGFTSGDKDYWQTMVFVDVPTTISGLTTIDLSNSMGETASSVLNVLSSSGVADVFDAVGSGPLTPNMITSMERLDHYVVSFAGGSVVPYAIELNLDYSVLNGYLVNPRGDLKNLAWSDTGTGYKVILITAAQTLTSLHDYKFYVAIAGGLVSLTTLDIAPGTVKAYDVNGNPVSGVSAMVALERGAAGLF